MKRRATLVTVFLLVCMHSVGMDSNQLRSFVGEWRNAWQSRDLDRYMACYSLHFRSDEYDYALWRKKKKEVFAASGFITVEVHDLELEVGEESAVIRFKQIYHSSAVSDTGIKTLVVEWKDGPVKIAAETWIPADDSGRTEPGAEAPVSAQESRAADLASTLAHAVEAGDLRAVEELLDLGAEVNVWDSNGKCPLHWAAFWGSEEMTKLLLRRGADVRCTDRNGWWTPLHAAVIGASSEAVVQALIEAGAPLGATTRFGRTPLHSARAGPARLLIDAGADVNARDRARRTPLHTAAAAGRTKVVVLLVSGGAEIGAKDGLGMTPLEYAHAMGHEGVISFLAALNPK